MQYVPSNFEDYIETCEIEEYYDFCNDFTPECFVTASYGGVFIKETCVSFSAFDATSIDPDTCGQWSDALDCYEDLASTFDGLNSCEYWLSQECTGEY